MPGTRAIGGDGEIRTHTLLFTRQRLCQLELHRLNELWSGREARASANSTIPNSQHSEGMSHAPVKHGGRSWNRTNLAGFSDPC